MSACQRPLFTSAVDTASPPLTWIQYATWFRRGQVRGLVGIGRGRREGHGRRSAGGGRRGAGGAVGKDRRPVDDGQAAMAAEAELGVERDPAGVGGTARPGPDRQRVEVEPVPGGPHRVGQAGGAERGGRCGRRVEQRGLHLVGPGGGVGRREGQGDRRQSGGRGRAGSPTSVPARSRPPGWWCSRPSRPASGGTPGRAHHGSKEAVTLGVVPDGEVVAGRRRGQVRHPTRAWFDGACSADR